MIYLACTMGLGTISVCCNILVLSISHNHQQTQPPTWILRCFRLPKPPYEAVDKTPQLLYRRESAELVASADSNLAEKGHYSSEEECAQNSINRQVAAGCKLRNVSTKDRNGPSSVDLTERSPGGVSHKPGYLWLLLAKRLDKMFFCIVFVLFVLNVLIVLLAPWHNT